MMTSSVARLACSGAFSSCRGRSPGRGGRTFRSSFFSLSEIFRKDMSDVSISPQNQKAPVRAPFGKCCYESCLCFAELPHQTLTEPDQTKSRQGQARRFV